MIDYSFLGIEGLTGDRMVKVWKRANGRVVYTLDDPKVRREWLGNDEVKMISFHELYVLSNSPGGMGILEYFLLIKDQEVLQALNLPMDAEYQYTEADCKTLVLKGTKDQILDALEFGGYGIATLIKKAAIDCRIDSTTRKQLLNSIFKFDLDTIYSNKEWAEGATAENTARKQRRATAITSEEKPKKGVRKPRKSTALEPTAPEENTITE